MRTSLMCPQSSAAIFLTPQPLFHLHFAYCIHLNADTHKAHAGWLDGHTSWPLAAMSQGGSCFRTPVSRSRGEGPGAGAGIGAGACRSQSQAWPLRMTPMYSQARVIASPSPLDTCS